MAAVLSHQAAEDNWRSRLPVCLGTTCITVSLLLLLLLLLRGTTVSRVRPICSPPSDTVALLLTSSSPPSCLNPRSPPPCGGGGSSFRHSPEVMHFEDLLLDAVRYASLARCTNLHPLSTLEHHLPASCNSGPGVPFSPPSIHRRTERRQSGPLTVKDTHW